MIEFTIDSPETVGELIDVLQKYPREMRVVTTGWDDRLEENYTTYLDVCPCNAVIDENGCPEVLFYRDEREPTCQVLEIS